MLDYRLIGRLPPVVRLSRNGQPIDARLARMGEITVEDAGDIAIADAACFEDDGGAPALPHKFPSGTYPIHAYRWDHRGESINVCVVISFRAQRLARTQRLIVHNEARPDLTDGVIVDTGEIVVTSGDLGFKFTSGLGDGYYPVHVVKNLGGKVQALIVDFKIWEVPRYILMKGQRLDEYGFVVSEDTSGA